MNVAENHTFVLVKIIKLKTLPIVHAQPDPSIHHIKAKQRQVRQHVCFYQRIPNQAPIPFCPMLFKRRSTNSFRSLAKRSPPQVTLGSTFLQPGGGTGTIVTKLFGRLLHVLLQEIVAGYAVCSHGAVEQPQLVVKYFDLVLL